MDLINITFTESQLILGCIYSRMEYIHATINGAMQFSPFKELLLNEATALINYCNSKGYSLPPHIIEEHNADMNR